MDYEIKIGNRTRKLKIETVPWKVFKMSSAAEQSKEELISIAQDEALLNQRIIELRQSREEGWFQECRSLRKEIKELGKEAYIAAGKALDNRFDLIKMILSKNGIKEDDSLMDRKTWEEEIDSKVINDFVTKCMTGDKKKEE